MAVEGAAVEGVGGVVRDEIVAHGKRVVVGVGGVDDEAGPSVLLGAAPGVAVAAVFDAGAIILVVVVGDDSDGSKAVAACSGGEDAVVDHVGVVVGLACEGVVAAGVDVLDGDGGGVIVDSVDGEVEVGGGGAAVNGDAVGVVAAGGEGGVPYGVGAADGHGVEFHQVAVEVGYADAHDAVAATDGGEGVGMQDGIGDVMSVPAVGAVGSHLLEGGGVRAVDCQVEHVVAGASVDDGVLDDVGRGEEHLAPGSHQRVAGADGLVGAVDTGEGDVEAHYAVTAAAGGDCGVEGSGGGEHRVAEGDAAVAAQTDGVDGVVGGGGHREEEHIGGVAMQIHHGGVGCVGLAGKVPGV